MQRRKFLAVSALAGLAGAGAFAFSNRRGTPPQLDAGKGSGLNVLFVLTDQERSWDQFPSGFIETHCPGRSALQEAGTGISKAFAPSQLCSMARGITYTGQHPQNNGVWENVPIPVADEMRRDIPNMGSVFRDAGYRTGYAGKWHLSKIEEMTPGADVRDEIRSYGFADQQISRETDGAHGGSAMDTGTVSDALDFIERGKGDAKPWFLAVNFLNPHDIMYYTANETMTASRKVSFPDQTVRPPSTPLYQTDLGYDVLGPWGPASRKEKPFAISEYARAMETNLGYMPFDDTDIARDFQNYYWNCIRDCDRHLKQLLDGLEASGEADRTIIVFTSDHGEYLGAHGLRGKGVSPYRQASQIPLLVVHPDITGGALRDTHVSQVDLLPTIAGLAGLSAQRVQAATPGMAGYDLSESIVGSGQSQRDQKGVLQHWTSTAFIDHLGGVKFKPVFEAEGPAKLLEMAKAIPQLKFENRGHMRAITTAEWTFARYFSPQEHNTPRNYDELIANNDVELYDNVNDPDQLTNLAAESEHAAKIAQLSANLNTLIADEIGSDEGDFLPVFV